MAAERRVRTRVDVQFVCEPEPDLPRARDLAAFARAALAAAGARCATELSVRVVDEWEGAELNRVYRHRTGATNVLSFPYEPTPGVNLPLLGDIVVCAPVVHREARAQAKSLRAHYAHMVVHGALHLLGHDHVDDAGARRMEGLEIAILARLGYPDPYRGTARQ